MTVGEQHVRDWLNDHLRQSQGRTQAVRAVSRRGSIYDCTTNRRHGAADRLVVKPLAAPCRISCATQLAAIQSRLGASSPVLADGLVPVSAINAEHDWIVMPHVAGRSLEQWMRQALRGQRRAVEYVEHALAQVARIVAEVHRHHADEYHLIPARQPNQQYLASMGDIWQHPIMRSSAPIGYDVSELLAMVCDAEFAQRVTDRMVPVDVQPKNVLVDDTGRAVLIDPDYVSGNPAITVATFLLNLDRLAIRHPSRKSWLRIQGWKSQFLYAYQKAGAGWVLRDTLAFYPWLLVRVMDEHVRSRRWAKVYLTYCYSRAVRDLLYAVSVRSLLVERTFSLAA